MILFLVIGFLISFWGYHASLTEILYIELIIIGLVCIAILSLWFTLNKISPYFYNFQAKITIPLTVPEDIQKEISLEYYLDKYDVLAYYLYNLEGSPQKRYTRKLIKLTSLIGLGIVLFAEIMLILTSDNTHLYAVIIIGIFIALAFFWLIFYTYLMRRVLVAVILKRYGQSQNRLTGKHFFSINSDIFQDSTEIGEFKTRWSAIKRIESTDQYLFIILQDSGPYIVPRKAFINDSSFKQFIDQATIYHQTTIVKK